MINPLIEPIARSIYKARQCKLTTANSEYVDPHHIETKKAIEHFKNMPHYDAVLLRGVHGFYIKVSWLSDETL